MKKFQIVIFTLLLTSALAGILDDAKEWMEGLTDEAKEQFDKIKKLNNNFEESVNKLPESIRDKILKRNFSSMPKEDVDKIGWDLMGAIQDDAIKTMDKNTLQDIVNQATSNVTAGTRNRMNMALADFMKTEGDAIATLKDNKKMKLEALKNKALEKIGDPKDWDVAKVNQLNDNDVLKRVPKRALGTIKDKMALKKILEKKDDLNEGGAFELMECRLQWGIHGTPDDQWDSTTLESSEVNVPDLLKGSLPLVEPEVLYRTNLPEGHLSGEIPHSPGKVYLEVLTLRVCPSPCVYESGFSPEVCRTVALKILEVNNSASNTKEQNKALFSELGRLGSCLQMGDLEPIDDSVMATIDEHRKVKNQSSKAAKEVLEYKLEKYNWDNVTDGYLIDLGGVIGEMPPDLLRNLSVRLNRDSFREIAVYLENNNGPAAKGKLRLLSKKAFEEFGADLPRSFIPGVPSDKLKGLTTDKIKKIAKYTELTKLQLSVILEKLNPADMDKDTSTTVKSLVPLEKLNSLSNEKLIDFADKSSSSARFLFTKNILKDVKNVTANDVNEGTMPTLWGPDQFKNISLKEIEGILMNMEGLCDYDVCLLLMDIYCDLRMKTGDFDNCQEVGRSLEPVDVSAMPPCVVAAFGAGVIIDLDDESKAILATRNSMNWEAHQCISAAIRNVISMQGLKAMGGDMGAVLPEGALADLNANIINVDEDMLNKISPGCAANFVLKKLNEMMAIPSTACLDQGQQDAVAKLIMKNMGDPSKWTSIRSVSCLLHLLPSDTIKKIPDHVLTSYMCQMPPPGVSKRTEELSKMTCKDKISMEELESQEQKMKDLIKLQKEKELKNMNNPFGAVSSSSSTARRKRQTSSSVCDTAVVQGISAVSSTDLEGTSVQDVINCLNVLTASKMEMIKAQIILSKIIELRGDISKLTSQDLVNLKYALRGIKKEDVDKLTSFNSPDFNDVVSTYGMKLDVPSDVCEAVATKVTREWKKPADMTGSQIGRMGQLICCVTTDDINAFKISSLKEALPDLRTIDNCSQEILNALGKRIGEEMGNTEEWGKAMVGELGPLIGTIAPEKLMKIPPESFNALSSDAVESLSTDHIKALTVDQLKTFPTVSMISLSDEQINAMPPEMQKVVYSKLMESSKKSEGFKNPVAWGLAVLALAFPIFA
ncbi:uncharacterized protein LOC143037383 [Oratosquilla oratoria]|uniref:uncharacterized protein LOC143037383 n=1 Tax=Oratosquilla oratoria TaxID=337810 RepID=UPI003F7706C0